MSTPSLSITESMVLTALRSFLLSILDPSVEVIQGQVNRVPEPESPDFVVMTPVTRTRLSLNRDTAQDVLFTGSISGTVLTITAVEYGLISVGSPVFGVGVAANTYVTAMGTGVGGVGTYTVNNTQTVASETLAAGQWAALQPTQIDIQLDVHGPNSTDNCQVITTLFRDAYACDYFASQPADMGPLYAEDGRQMPFINGENQFEYRWVCTVSMQANPVVSTGLQYADKLAATLVNVDATFPPGA